MPTGTGANGRYISFLLVLFPTLAEEVQRRCAGKSQHSQCAHCQHRGITCLRRSFDVFDFFDELVLTDTLVARTQTLSAEPKTKTHATQA